MVGHQVLVLSIGVRVPIPEQCFMKKVLLFPGAFNPPHLGHVKMIEIALEKERFDEIWIIPSGKRIDKAISTSYEDRRNLGNLFVTYLQNKFPIPTLLNTVELDDLDGKPTEDILKEIKSNNEVEMTQLIGLDGYLNLRDGLEDTKEKFLIINRQGFEPPSDLSETENVKILDGETLDISSTKVRLLVKDENMEYTKLVPENIATYISEHKDLYR